MTSPSPASAPAPAPAWALPAAMLGGVCGALQSRINARLALELGDGFTAAAASFGSGLIIVLAIFAVRRPLRERARSFVRDLRAGAFPWPLALGGLGGAIFVLGQSLSVALIGVALFIVCVVASASAPAACGA